MGISDDLINWEEFIKNEDILKKRLLVKLAGAISYDSLVASH